MKETFVLAVILVLLCFCLSFGNGNELIAISKARKCVRGRYAQLFPYSEKAVTLRPQSTTYQHLAQMKKREKSKQTWLPGYTVNSLKQLNNLPESFKSEDERKLATEYHLWQSDWFYVRFLTLKKAAERESRAGDGYPPVDECKDAASTAFKRFTNHQNLYLQFYQSLGDEARRDSMKRIQFQNWVDSELQNNEDARNIAIKTVRLHLEKNLRRTMSSMDVKTISAVEKLLTPAGVSPNEYFLSDLRKFFPVEDLSRPPHEASRRDKEFLEIGWLLNQYRSIWYELRHNDIINFFQHWKFGEESPCVQRLKDAIAFTNNLAHSHKSLSNYYYFERFEKYHPNESETAPNTPKSSELIMVDGHEEIQSKGERKWKTLDTVQKVVSKGKHEATGGPFFHDIQIGHHDSQDSRPNKRKPASASVTENMKNHTIKKTRSKCAKKICKSATDVSEQKTSLEQEEYEPPHASPADSYLRLGPSLPQAKTGLTDDDVIEAAHIPYINALRNLQQQCSTRNARVPLGTDCVTKVDRHDLTQELFHESRLEDDILCDYRSTDEEFLKDLYQPALETCLVDCLITDNEGISPASNESLAHLQSRRPLANDEEQHETDAIELEEQRKLFDLEQFSDVDSLLEDYYFEKDAEHQTPDRSAAHAMTVLGQPRSFELDDTHETGASNLEFSKITENKVAGDWQSNAESRTNTLAVNQHENSLELENPQALRFPNDGYDACTNYRPGPTVVPSPSEKTLYSNHPLDTVSSEIHNEPDLARSEGEHSFYVKANS